MAALSQAQAEANREAQKAGIAHAQAGSKKAYLGRKPSYTEGQVADVITLSGEGKGVSVVAKQLGLSRAAVYRILKSPGEAVAAVRAWR